MLASGRASTWVPRKWLAMAIRLRGARMSISAPAQAASGPEAAEQIRPLPPALAPIAAERVAGKRAKCRHQPQRDRQVVVAAFLWQVRRSEIDSDLLGRHRKAGG